MDEKTRNDYEIELEEEPEDDKVDFNEKKCATGGESKKQSTTEVTKFSKNLPKIVIDRHGSKVSKLIKLLL